MNIYFAPIQGYTEDVYRRLHNEIFGGIDQYYSPFIRLEHGGVRSKDLRDIRPEFNEGVNVTPQIIVSGGKEAEELINIITTFGYSTIDINMGCPFPLQTRHGRGAGILQHKDKVQEVADVIKNYPELKFSVKMRLGLVQNDEWKEVLPILNSTPLQHFTIHPRTGIQQYRGDIQMDMFEQFVEASEHPIIYNGEINTIEDIHIIEKKGNAKIKGVMIGRGLLARPSLAIEYKTNNALSDNDLLHMILEFHSRLKEHYEKIIPGETQMLNKLRTYWDYMEPTLGRKKWKKIMKAGNAKNYFREVNNLR